jgi:hypothetical protein
MSHFYATPSPTNAELLPSLPSAAWCSVLLTHLDTFATMAWYLVADGQVVERVLLRSFDRLADIRRNSWSHTESYSQTRDIVIVESLAAIDKPNSMRPCKSSPCVGGKPPDVPRLESLLRNRLAQTM